MIKDSLRHHRTLRHTLVYSNKTWADVIFRDALAVLESAHPDRLRVQHFLTRESDTTGYGPGVRAGRVAVDLLRDALTREPDSLIYACGPAVTVWERRACAARGETPSPQFLEAMLDHLHALDVPKSRIKLEAFG
jgi:ferredoxin-NADP reductase